MQRLRRLSGRRAARSEEAAFVVDGPVLVRGALEAGLHLQEVFVSEDADPALVSELGAAGVSVREVKQGVLARAVDAVTPQGVAAVVTRPEVPLVDALDGLPPDALVLVLADIADPGNGGTLLRTAEAAGASAVLFCGSSVDPCNPKCVRASAGALFNVPVASGGETVGVLDLLRDAGISTLATAVSGAAPYDTVDLTGPTAIVLGNEAHGLPDDVLRAVDSAVSIPMAGRAESLNVAMAGSVLCFEALRQRRATT